MSKKTYAWIAGLVLALWPAVAFAQLDTATVLGQVSDSQQAVLPGVAVTARNVDTGFTRVGTTNEEGKFRIPAVPPGRYEFVAELQGFNTAIRRGVTIALGAEVVINLTLDVGTRAEAIQVTAEAPVVETTTSAVQTSLNRDAIDLLPLIGRDYTTLIRLAPGVTGTQFVGGRERSNSWFIDGVDNSEDISGFDRQTPGLDAIGEVQVLVNGFKAEYGSSSGGVVNVVTRSGTNTNHGSGFLLFRDQDLMSQSPYANRSLGQDPFRRLNYGATFGGPLKKDRMHFFATYEREDRDTNTSSTRTLPASTANFAASTLQFLRDNGIDPALFGAGGSVRQVRPEFVDVHDLTAKLDAQLKSTQFLTVRSTLERERTPSGESGTLFDFNGADVFFRTFYSTFNHKWVLGGNRLNEAFFQVGQTKGDWRATYPGLTNVSISGGFDLGGPDNYPQGRTDHVYQFVDNFSWTMSNTRTGSHTLKAGTQIKIFKSDSFFDSNFRGTYTFPSLQAFINGTPTIFTQGTGDTRLRRPNDIYGIYFQDDWQVLTGLTLNLGLRYDFEGAKTEALRDVNGEAGPGISGDRNNFAPRFGFAYAPNASTKQVIYGGFGKYYDQVILNVVGNARFTPPKVINVRIENPGWPDPRSGNVQIPPANLSVIDPALQTPYSWNAQIGYRRELMKDLGIDVSFVHNRGYDQVGILNTNAGIPGRANLLGVGIVRPDPTIGSRSFYSNYGEIRYKGLLVDVTKRLSRRVQGGVAYTLSKAENNLTAFNSGYTVNARPDLSYGPNESDRRHRLRSHVEVMLPWDIQFATIVEFTTEAPLNILSGRDLNGDGSTGDWFNEEICINIQCPGDSYRRNNVRELSTEEANRLRRLINLSPIQEFADNPKYFNADLSLKKSFRFGIHRISVTAEAFNLFNIPQRTIGSATVTSANFGRYTAVEQPRAVQFTMQYDF